MTEESLSSRNLGNIRTVCYFGFYKRDYGRNRAIIMGLEAVGVEVIEVHTAAKGLAKYVELWRKHRSVSDRYDLMIVGFGSHWAVFLARLISRKPLVFDLHVSLYDSVVLERKQCSRHSLRALKMYLLDKWACMFAHRVLMDTKRHASYVAELLGVQNDKFVVVYHGADLDNFRPQPRTLRNDERFIVECHGFLQTLNGMEYVVDALRSVQDEDIFLEVTGGGVAYEPARNQAEHVGATNISFFPPVPPHELATKIGQADLALGLFGLSAKIGRVIPNKLYEAIALHIPVLTGESAAAEELFTHKREVYFCPRGNSRAIVDALRELKEDPVLRQRMAMNAAKRLQEICSPQYLGGKLLEDLKPIYA